MTKHFRGLAAVVAAVALLTGCSNDQGTTAPQHNDADVAFAQQMIPHHAQAVAMAELAEGRTSNPVVLDLAKRIKAAQDPEIELMTGWLKAWGADVPAGDHGGHGADGMMSADEMTALEGAKDADFDGRFAEMMIRHHQGAITTAETELAEGTDPAAKELARRVIDAQRAEISELQALLPQG